MIPWKLLGTARVPGDSGEELVLYQRGEEFSIRVGNCELMNSRVYGSEDALGEITCKQVANSKGVRVLIGGMGMGYTIRAALRQLRGDAQVVVAELVPEVVKWNKGPLGHLAEHPLRNKRVTVKVGDVAKVIKARPEAYDAIMLDVDNGPEGLTQKDNDWLYSLAGLRASYDALKQGGVLAVWSAGTNKAFMRRLKQVGFRTVEETRVRARGSRGGSRYTIWFATRGD